MTTPKISVEITIAPSTFHIDAESASKPPTLTITATLEAEGPITIFTWPTIFNLHFSQKRTNFTCQDVTAGVPVGLEITKGPKRPAFSREAGGRDDAYLCTLEPGVACTFSAPFKAANRPNTLASGHRYLFSVSKGETVRWWKYGRKEDVMAPEGQPAGLGDPKGPSIVLELNSAVEFEVL